VTITLDRVFQHLERDASGGIMSDSTYVIDPSPKSHNVLAGEIKDGVLRITPDGCVSRRGNAVLL